MSDEKEPRFERPYQRPTEFAVLCPDCGERIRHKCHDAGATEMKKALVEFLTWIPRGPDEKVAKAIQKAGETSGWLEKGQDFTKSAIFGEQAWSYSLFGKEGGRSFSGRIDAILRAAGFDAHEFRAAAFRAVEQDRKATENFQANTAADAKARKSAIALFQSKTATMEEKTALLDKLVAEKTMSYNPLRKIEGNQIHDDWMRETMRWLDRRYDGGINRDMNRLRIEAARKIALDTGLFTVTLFGAEGVSVFARRFKERAEVDTFLKETNAKYDALSKDPYARAVFVKVKTRGKYETENFLRGAKGEWVPQPKSEKVTP